MAKAQGGSVLLEEDCGGGGVFGHQVGNRAHFFVGVHLAGYALELTQPFNSVQPVTQVGDRLEYI
ncbi:hypothetical protein D9M68_980610 [compost metagenome]